MSDKSAQRAPSPWWVAVVAGMASYIDAAAIVSFGLAIVLYQKPLNLSPIEVGLASGSLTFAIAIGAIVGGRLGDRFGRRPIFSVTMILIVAGCLALFLATSFTTVLIGALLVGLGTGADLPVSLSTISEAAHEGNRGKLLGFSNLLWLAGAIIAGIGGASVSSLGLTGAQILWVHIGVVSLLVLVGRLTIPESTVWRTARNERRLGTATIRADRARVLDLLRPPYRGAFLALIGFYALANLAANTSGQFGTYILVNLGGVPIAQAASIGLIVIPISIAGFLWFMRIADGPRRFAYFTVGAVAMILSQLVLVVLGVSIPTFVVSAVLFVIGGSFAFEGIMKAWAQESFPTLVRTTAQGTIIAVARLAAAAFAVFTPALVTAGPQVLYGILTALVTVGMVVAWLGFRRRDQHDEFAVEAEEDAERIAGEPISSH